MKVEDLKWYSPFVFLVGAILSFADPITDILTLVEFYRNDHKTWFGVGLAFVILPCLVFPILLFLKQTNDEECPGEDKDTCTCMTICCTRAIALGLHPFSAALARLEGFAFSLKKRWRGDDENDAKKIEKGNDLLRYIYTSVLFESVLESAPQFIIQLYAMNAQEEPVQIIQMISLPVSFLSLNWAFAIIDEMVWFDEEVSDFLDFGDLTLRRKIFILLTHFFLLSSRLFAVCYFTVAFKWWVIGVLVSHTFVMTMAITILSYSAGDECGCDEVFVVTFFGLGLHWLRDDVSVLGESSGSFLLMVPFSNVLFVIENYVMILMFYFSQHSNSWFSLPVTVCVCLFSAIGSTMRIAGLYVFIKQERGKDVMNPQSNSSDNSAPAEMIYWTSTV